MQDRTALELRNLCPLAEVGELAREVGTALRLEAAEVTIKSLRMNRDGTQAAVVEVPTNALKEGTDGDGMRDLRIVSGVTVAKVRLLPRTTRCYGCHRLGHKARDCPVTEEGEERCRKCGGGGTLSRHALTPRVTQYALNWG